MRAPALEGGSPGRPCHLLKGTTLPDDQKKAEVPSGKAKASDAPAIDPATGTALRSVYQATVDESIPDEMLDLLGKLT
jgi:hypothetical protein